MGFSNVKMRLYALSGLFKLVGCLLAQSMYTSVNIGVIALVIISNHINHLGWRLGSSGIV